VTIDFSCVGHIDKHQLLENGSAEILAPKYVRFDTNIKIISGLEAEIM
jgi:hypothetical protein